MDLQMPIMDGFEAASIIRELDESIPIIALTANARREDIQNTLAVGMNEHLNKPLDIEKLYKMLLKYISVKSSVNKQNDKFMTLDKLPEFITIDTSLGLKHLSGNIQLYMKILTDFYIKYHNLELENLEEEKLKIVLHTLKGLSANIGAEALHIAIKEFEDREGKKLFLKIVNELNLTLRELKDLTYIEEEKHKKKEELSEEEKNDLLVRLKDAVLTKRPNRCKEVIQEVSKYNLSKDDEADFIVIKALVEKYKFKEAIEKMKEI